MDTDEKSQKAWISHFVGNWLVQARFSTQRGQSAEPVKNELVSKLDSRTSGALVDEVKCLIRGYDWSDREGVELFYQDYESFERRNNMGNQGFLNRSF